MPEFSVSERKKDGKVAPIKGKEKIAKERLVIGRDPTADLVFSGTLVAEHHAFLELLAGRLFVEDQGSLSGTYLNGRLLAARTELKGGEKIVVGRWQVEVAAVTPEKVSVTQEVLPDLVERGPEDGQLDDQFQGVFHQKRPTAFLVAVALLVSVGGFVVLPLAGTKSILAEPLAEVHTVGGGGRKPESCAACHAGGLSVENCAECHEAPALGGPHGYAIASVRDGLGFCTECHLEHRGAGADPIPAWARAGTEARGCRECHAGAHPEGRLTRSAGERWAPDVPESEREEAIAHARAGAGTPADEPAAGTSQPSGGETPPDAPGGGEAAPPPAAEAGAGGWPADWRPIARDREPRPRADALRIAAFPHARHAAFACMACHAADDDFRTSVGYATCAACHARGEAEPPPIAGAERAPQWPVVAHGSATECRMCHVAAVAALAAPRDERAALETLALTRPALRRVTFRTKTHDASFGACDECHIDDAIVRDSRIRERPFLHSAHLRWREVPQDADAKGRLNAQCLVCHDAMRGASGFAAEASHHGPAAVGQCLQCHAGGDGAPAVDARTWLGEGTTRFAPVRAFDHADHTARYACTDCHSGALADQGERTPADVRTCVRCHTRDHTQAGGQAWRTGETLAACTHCHTGADDLFRPAPATKRHERTNFSHATPSHRNVTVVEGCNVCHEAVWQASNVEQVTVPRMGQHAKCIECHGSGSAAATAGGAAGGEAGGGMPAGDAMADCFRCHHFHTEARAMGGLCNCAFHARHRGGEER